MGRALKLISKSSRWDEKERGYGHVKDVRAKRVGVACAFHGMGSSKGGATMPMPSSMFKKMVAYWYLQV